ncbi:MAG: hypothetical protein CVU65_10740 [Deltaproteobacteria bacterium HGW-Deltaproteobacteria-22]|jgi:hypothetical protein|nr:MAG: hypothetical protein CVU65_10740 [Deltaproteobacteria bacterium HGW-Deltaproteobacteria-22]
MKFSGNVSAFSGFWIGLAILAPVLGLTLGWSVFSSETPRDALLRGGALALPLSLAGAVVVALIADRLPERGRLSWLVLWLTILILALSFVLMRNWVIAGGSDVRIAAADAMDKNGYYLTRQLWDSYGAWSLLLLPVLILTLVLDSIVLAFLPLFHPPFWGALGLLLLRVMSWLAIGGGLSMALTAGLMHLWRRPRPDHAGEPPGIKVP